MKAGKRSGIGRMGIGLLAFGVACGLPEAAVSGTADSEDSLPVLALDTVLARVVARNPELRMWELRAQGKAAAVRGAKAWMPPELGVGGSELPYGMASDMTPGDPALMVSARQMVPGPGKRAARRRYLLSLAGQDAAEGLWMRARLLSDAKAQYFRMGTSTRKLAVLREAEGLMALMLEVAEVRFKFRRADMATVFEARARLEELQAMQSMEASLRRQARSSLAFLMASPDLPPFAVDTLVRLRGYAEAPGEPLAGRRGDLLRIDKELQSMELNQELMRRQGRPDFGIQFDHMEMFGMGRRYSAMAMMTIPLAPWSSAMVRSEVKAMRKDIESMRAEREARTLMARRMAAEMLLMLRSETAQVTRFTDEISPAYRKSLDAALAAYQEGAGDLFRVLDTWDRWVMARLKTLEHLEKALVLEAEYERESGKL